MHDLYEYRSIILMLGTAALSWERGGGGVKCDWSAILYMGGARTQLDIVYVRGWQTIVYQLMEWCKPICVGGD